MLAPVCIECRTYHLYVCLPVSFSKRIMSNICVNFKLEERDTKAAIVITQ